MVFSNAVGFVFKDQKNPRFSRFPWVFLHFFLHFFFAYFCIFLAFSGAYKQTPRCSPMPWVFLHFSAFFCIFLHFSGFLWSLKTKHTVFSNTWVFLHFSADFCIFLAFSGGFCFQAPQKCRNTNGVEENHGFCFQGPEKHRKMQRNTEKSTSF